MSKVLVADDSATIRGVAESLLRHNGYEVISTSDGGKALAMAKSQKPDLIFLDHVMPGKDGLSVCRELKADPQLRNIPVIMLLSAGEAREGEKFLAAGASDYLFKPFVPKDFIEKAQKFLSPFAQRSVSARDTGKIAASSLLEEALSSATKEEGEELDLEKLLGAASSKQLEEETGKVPVVPPQKPSPSAEVERWGETNPDEMTIKLYSQEEKTKPKLHERPKAAERSKTGTGPVKSDSDKLKLEKEKEDLILASNPFGLGEEDLDLAFGTGGSQDAPHDYDWFLKEMQKESQAPSGPSKQPAPAAPPPSRRKEETSEELKLKVEEMGTSRLGYERFINEFKKEMMKLETEEKPVYGETKIDPQAVVEAQQKVKTDKVKIPSVPATSVPATTPPPAAPALSPEELVNQVVSAVVKEVAQRLSSQLDKEEILRLLQEKLGKLGK